MSENLVRDVHDAVAASSSYAEASVRPPSTTPRQLAAMRRDVLRKLRVRRECSVLEIGCGIALLGLPVAARAQRYVGLDFAPRAVEVANERLRAAGLQQRAVARGLDVLSAKPEELGELGAFDRVLMYAVLHYARTEEEARCFLQRAVDLLAPGGLALIGNLPLDDLQADWAVSARPPRGVAGRALAVLRWVGTPGTARVPLTRRWKAARVVQNLLNRRSAGESFAPAMLPPDYTLSLTTTDVERRLAAIDREFSFEWRLPAPGVPLAAGRADLILIRRP